MGLAATPAQLEQVLRRIKQEERANVSDEEFRAMLRDASPVLLARAP